MHLSLRWFGPDDAVGLNAIRQIPGVTGIVASLYDLPPGVPWPRERVQQLREQIEEADLRLVVIESIPVHEDIKLGRRTRDRYIEAFQESLRVVGEQGIPVVCYNFMPVFDWTRTNLALPLEDGSTCLSYDDAELAGLDPARGFREMPAWIAYTREELAGFLEAYREVDGERLWDHLAYFLERVVPVAEEAGVVLGIHPDDPPWSIFGLPRIITDEAALERLLRLVDRPANGLTLCTGSLGADPRNDLPAMIRRFGGEGRIHFAHVRNVRVTGPRQFHESAHPSRFGSVDISAVMKAYHEVGFRGPLRPDHGRMIWGETGRPGYGLYDRALGAMYISGLWEAYHHHG